jgi:cytochrome c553
MRYFIFLTALVFLVSGCGEKEKKEETKTVEQTNTTPQIQIIENATVIEEESPFIKYDMDGNRVVRIAPDGEETPLTKEIGALATIKNNYENLNAKILSQRLSKNYIVKCSACHDDYANGVVGPSLLDKSAEEIFDKIKAYQDLTKVNVLMKYLVSQMEDEEIKSLAKEIADLNSEVRENR